MAVRVYSYPCFMVAGVRDKPEAKRSQTSMIQFGLTDCDSGLGAVVGRTRQTVRVRQSFVFHLWFVLRCTTAFKLICPSFVRSPHIRILAILLLNTRVEVPSLS